MLVSWGNLKPWVHVLTWLKCMRIVITGICSVTGTSRGIGIPVEKMADIVAEQGELGDGAGGTDPAGGPGVAGMLDGINVQVPGETTQAGMPTPGGMPEAQGPVVGEIGAGTGLFQFGDPNRVRGFYNVILQNHLRGREMRRGGGYM